MCCAARLRTERRWWWVVAGSGTAVTLAVMAKGLGIGLILLGVIGAFSLLDWRRLVGNLGRVLLPLALLSVIYTAFPSPLLTLQAQIDIAEQGSRPTPPKAGPANATSSTAGLFEGGYIFGRSMSPQMLKQTVLDAQDTTQDRGQRLSASINGQPHALPAVARLPLKPPRPTLTDFTRSRVTIITSLSPLLSITCNIPRHPICTKCTSIDESYSPFQISQLRRRMALYLCLFPVITHCNWISDSTQFYYNCIEFSFASLR